jgi:uncharacterized membrane protein YfcA
MASDAINLFTTSPALGYGLLVAVGLVAGALNVVAGGGSFLTLPALIFLGLPAGAANATNRVGIVLQNVGAIWSFDRDGVLDRRSFFWGALPATAGSLVGTFLALRTSDEALQKILGLVMIVFALLSFWTPRRQPFTEQRSKDLFLGSTFFLIGIYGGFLQAGIGFLTLAVTSLAGIDLVRGNAIKVLMAFCSTLLSVLIFAWYGLISWPLGLALGAGNFLGGLAGARLAVLKGHAWLRVVVSVAIVVFAVKLLVA